jgi:hypothetical protein
MFFRKYSPFLYIALEHVKRTCNGWNELALFNVGEDIKGKPKPDRWCSFNS